MRALRRSAVWWSTWKTLAHRNYQRPWLHMSPGKRLGSSTRNPRLRLVGAPLGRWRGCLCVFRARPDMIVHTRARLNEQKNVSHKQKAPIIRAYASYDVSTQLDLRVLGRRLDFINAVGRASNCGRPGFHPPLAPEACAAQQQRRAGNNRGPLTR